MSCGPSKRSFGRYFESVAEEYERVRPGYSDAIVDAAVRRAGLSAAARVLEVGAGTGKLTRMLVARGLRVTAVEPGEAMIEVARRALVANNGDAVARGASSVSKSGAAEFACGRFEEVALPEGAFAAVFSATAFHWVDPRVGWRRAASVLPPGGTLGLIQYVPVHSPETEDGERAMRAALLEIAPELAPEFRELRSPEALVAGALARRANPSEVFAWLGNHLDVVAEDAAELFEAAELDVVPHSYEESAEQANAIFRSTSLYARLGPDRAARLEAEYTRLIEQRGGVLRGTTLAVLVTARRR